METLGTDGIVPSMDKWIELVKGKMREQKVTQEQLAERVGVSQGAVAHWLGGRRVTDLPTMNLVLRELGMGNLEVAQVLCTAEEHAAYDVSVDELSRASLHDRNSLHQSVAYYCYPRLSWAVAGTDEPSRASYYRGDAEVSGYESVGPAYWLQMEGDAMNAPSGISVPQGMEVLVDPGLKPQVGDLVIARREGAEHAIMRQLAMEGSERYLKPLNPMYPAFVLTAQCRVVGVVVQALSNWR
jgi:SOS-response transcriptional repressor LexA